MEQLLLVLFILFSIVSALLERRKRKAQLAEAQAKQRQRRETEPAPTAAEPVLEAEPEQEDAWGGWPLPGPDPFDMAKPKPARRRTAEPRFETDTDDPVELASPGSAEAATQERLEREARQAEEGARRQEARARREEGRAHREENRARDLRHRETPAMRSVARLLEKGLQPVAPRGGQRRGACGYALTPRSARRAVVWAEIIGPCKAEGQQEDRW